MAFFEKLNAITKNVGDKTNDMIETTKLNGKITKEKASIEEKKLRLGGLYWEKFAAGAQLDADAAEICGEIKASFDAIAGFEAEIAAIKKENEKKQEQPAGPQQAQLPTGSTFCPVCGTVSEPGAAFCMSCGSALKPEIRLCPKCGAELQAGSVFCSECGAKA
ncbi:MAG: zinc ribbon domain-containing protein [Clostridiales bacterium]|nr:zinc ribbon domain-containing protein [Clostridiales bacterium]